MSDETRKIVNLVGTSAQFSSGGGRKGLAGHDTDLGSWKCQLDASGNFAVYARRDDAQTFTGLQTFNAGVTVAGGASRFTVNAGTGVRMATFAADGTLSVATDATTARSLIGALAESEKGSANGVAPLGSDSKIAATYLPSYVDDVIEFAGLASFPATGEAGKIYVTKDTNRTYRWSGSAYVEISASLALGETSSTAYRGDRGKTAYDHSQITAANPHGTTFAQLASKPTTLSGYGIMDAQPLDSDLTAIAALSTQAFGRSLLTQADAAAVRTAIGASDGKELLNWYTPATRPADCDLEPDGLGGLRRFLAVAGTANGPSTTQTSHVLHIGHDGANGYDTQLASEATTGALRSRAQTAGVWGAWRTFWDSVNLPASAIGKTLLNVADAAAARTLIDVSGAERLNRTIGTTAGTAWIRFAQIDLTAAGGAAIYGVITSSGASVSSGWVNFSASLYAMTMSGSAVQAVLSESHGSNTYLSIGFVVEQDDGTRKRLALYAKTTAPMSVQMSVFTSNGAVATYSGVAPVTTQPTGFVAATAA